ncbi:YoaK family protein [Sphingomonas sp.]|uniref:YoaK family protein n=1 Tax=Sphingomonas sp. TaxID=28214 RepID=UPI002DD6B773|nr:YoaK family protein [Sphingomonas sp.]
MTRTSPAMIVMATALAALAGFVDAVAWIELVGFFASFMSGNTTRLGIGIGHGDWAAARMAGGLILMFLSGVIAATVVAHRFDRRHKPPVMALATLALATAALCAWLGQPMPALLLLAFAMGAENGVFHRDGEVSIGLTYMTGTLVRCGQHMAAALMGTGARLAWAPYLVLWLGFLCGGVLGAVASTGSLAGAITAAALLSLSLTIALALLTRPAPRVERRPSGG